jgi:hypothetical protein
MKENKSELVFMKKENILDLINLNESSSEYFSNIMNFQYNHKLLLEKMLKIIKNIQLEILSEKSFIKTNNKLSSKIIINILKDLKIELNSIFKDKKQKYTRIKYRPKKICNHSLIQTFTKDSKNILINPRLGSELFKLKLSNFKLENQIACIDDKIKLISYSILNANNNAKFLYLFFNRSNEESPASKILHDNLLCARDIFKIVVKKKAFQNNVINQLNTAITILKEENQVNKKKYKNEYIITSQIINEETKEYPTKISSFANEKTTEKGKIKMNEIEGNVLYKDKLIYH